MIGKNRVTKKRIFAQCKKDPFPYTIEPKYFIAFANLENATKYFFAYGGINGAHIPGVNHMSSEDIIGWLEDDPDGRNYRDLLGA